MKPDYNHSYANEQGWESIFDRSEDIGEDPICPECKNEGQTEYCLTCGNHHEACECDDPDLITEECEACQRSKFN